ncbi:chaperonin GroEL [Plantactinospora sp. KLBMP9567]|uniref:chaperonin GroEL n=1 Tax=Plantactinospora sp. KLBMP9567 TaxID=3085900 RepID=UPI002982202D|nr:chaperonin GroEL [Plantactinospora sp. KLBMP9567]MDW5329733.1 chaperonin GroEL [Plantactinospora sp. KLBMP9567]
MRINPPAGRYALLVAVGEYDDPSLDQLRAPEQDVERLAAVLEDPSVGNFTVRTLQDAPDQEVRREIEDLLTDRVNDDLVLLYFSCHGIVDPFHRLYFAAANTVRTRPASTAISRSFVNEQLEACRAAAKVLVLDCCFAGAFAEGFKGAPQGALEGQVGRGYVVISACDSYEYAFESDGLVESAPRGSIFTDVLLEGLATGGADLDGDGRVGVDELFRYVHDGVVRRRPDQKPKWSAYNAEPHIYLATVPPTANLPAAGEGRPGGVVEATAAAVPRPSNFNRHQAIVARGFRAGADLVRRTFGPLGRRVLVEDASGAYHELADAASVVRLFTAYDTRDAIGASYVRELVEGVRHRVGDGATTTVVLAQAMLDGASAALRAGANPVALCRGIESAALAVLSELGDLAVPVETKEQLKMVSTIASGDEVIGDLLATAMERVGKDGVVIVEESNLFGLELELTRGTRVPAGHVSPYFVTDPEEAEAVLDDPSILIVDQRLSAVPELQPLLDEVGRSGRPLAVFARDVRDAALTALIVGKMRHTLNSVAVRLPWPDEERCTVMADLALLTGAQVVGDAEGGLAAATAQVLGGARKVITTRRDTTLVDGAGDPDLARRRVQGLRAELARRAAGRDRELLRERLARLGGGVAVIRVGESTEGQLKKRKRQIDDAVRNAKAAVEWGLVPGGGAALLTVAGRIGPRLPPGGDEALGYAVVVDALVAPYEELMRNAGRDPEAGPADLCRRGPGVTFDVVAGAYVTALDAGIVDAAATLRQAVTAAAGVVTRYLMIG